MINAKKARREERILEFKNYLTKNVDYISVQKSSLMNKNIVSVIKKKRFTKIEQNNKIIFKEDQNYNSLVRTFKANREEIINPKETAPINTDQGILLPTQPSNFPFPYEEMQEKSSISFNPNEEYLEMFPPPESIESDLKPITPPRPKTSNAPQSHSRAGRGKSEPGNIYNSFFSQLPETKFNKFIARKSKMYVDDQRSKTPSPGPRKVEDNKRRAVTPNVGYNPNTRKGMIIVENPLKGLNYTASLPYEEKKIIDKTVQKGYRICSQDTQISDVLDPEHFLKDRIDIKNNIKQKIENASPPKPKNEEKFFTPAQLKVSDENYVDIFRTTTRLLKMPVHEPKITPRPKPRPSTSIASRTHAANTSASQRLNNCVSKSTNVKKSESRVFEEETSYRIHEIHANRPKSAIQQQEEKGKEKYVINTSIELTPIREDVRFVTDDYFTSKRGNNISPYSGKFEVSRDLASYSEAFSPGSIDKTQAFKETMFNSHKFEKIEKHQESEFKKVTNNRSTSVPQSRAVTPLQMYRQKYAQNVGKTISQSDQAEQTEKPEKPVSEQQISPTKEVINKLAKSQVHHKAPKFFTKHRALSINDSNLFNRVPVVDKSHLLPSRRASDAESVEVFRKKKKKKNFVVEGKRERFSKSVRKVRGH